MINNIQSNVMPLAAPVLAVAANSAAAKRQRACSKVQLNSECPDQAEFKVAAHRLLIGPLCPDHGCSTCSKSALSSEASWML